MRRRNLLLGSFAMLTLGACGTWGITYNDEARNQAANWRVSELNVVVSPSLSVSLDDVLQPDADIVWWEKLPVDPSLHLSSRRPTVRKLLADNTRVVLEQLNGSRSVRVDVVLVRFHGLTPTAYRLLEISGVHNVVFDVVVYDTSSGARLAQTRIVADTPALNDAERARQYRQGITDSRRVGATIQRALAGWLGLVADSRGQFSRLGA